MTWNQPWYLYLSAPIVSIPLCTSLHFLCLHQAYTLFPASLNWCFFLASLFASHFFPSCGRVFQGFWQPFCGGQRAVFPPQDTQPGLAAAKGLTPTLVFPLFRSSKWESAERPPEQEMLGTKSHPQGGKSTQDCSLFSSQIL